MNSQTMLEPAVLMPSCQDGINTLFDEIQLAIQWRKPAYLMAVHSQPDVHMLAMSNLADRLIECGYSTYTIDAAKTLFSEFLWLVSNDSEPENKVYFVENLAPTQGRAEQDAWQTFYYQRDNLDSRLTKVIFWLTEEQLVNLVVNFPAYWENRCRVIDLTNPEEKPDIDQVCQPPLQVKRQGPSPDESPANMSEAWLTEAQENLSLGVQNWREGDKACAYRYLQNALDLAEALADIELQVQCQQALALVLMDSGNLSEAIGAYQYILEIHPESALPWNNLGNLYSRLNQLPEAEQAFLRALKHNQNDAVSWVGMADLYQKTNRLAEALDACRQALRIVPNFTTAWFSLGSILEKLNKPNKAIKAYKMVVKNDTDNTSAWLQLAKIYKNLKNPAESMNILKKALQFLPEDSALWMELGDAAAPTDSLLAAEAYRKVLTINPCHGPAYCKLASVQKDLGDMADARRCYEIGINFLEEDEARTQAWSSLLAIVSIESSTTESFTPEQVEAAEPVFEYSELEYFASQAENDADTQALHAGALSQSMDNIQLLAANEAPVQTGTAQPAVIDWEKEKMPQAALSYPEASAFESAGPLSAAVFSSAPAWLLDEKYLARELNHTRGMQEQRSRYEQIALLMDARFEQPRSETYHPHKKARHIVKNTTQISLTAPNKEKPIMETIFNAEPASQKKSSSQADIKEAQTWIRQGDHLLKRGFYEDALTAYSAAAQAAPDLGTAFVKLGITFFFQSKYELALTQFDKGIELTTDKDEKILTWNYIGDTYRRLRDGENAMRAYQKASEIKHAENPLKNRARQVLVFGNCYSFNQNSETN